MNPAYTELGLSVFFKQAGKSYGASEGREREQVEWLWKLDSIKKITKILDIGCYDGRFLRSFPGPIKRVGIDFDKSAIESAGTQDPDGEYHCGLVENLSQEKVGTVDLISLIHSIEHTTNPKALLQSLLSISQPETLIYIETPIIELATESDGDINGFFSVQHMTHFSRNSLKRLVVESGFEIVKWFEHSDYNAARVLLTPKTSEIAEYAIDNRNYDDVLELHRYLESWHASIKLALRKLFDSLKFGEDLIIWGAGAHTEILFQHAGPFWTSFYTRIIDKDSKKVGNYFRGLEVEPVEILLEIDLRKTIFLVSSYAASVEITQHLLNLGVPNSRIIRLYDVIKAY